MFSLNYVVADTTYIQRSVIRVEDDYSLGVHTKGFKSFIPKREALMHYSTISASVIHHIAEIYQPDARLYGYPERPPGW